MVDSVLTGVWKDRWYLSTLLFLFVVQFTTPVLELTQLVAVDGYAHTFQDAGAFHYTVKQLDQGKQLYSEIGYPYGELGIQLLRGWTHLFGNTPNSANFYYSFLNCVFLLNLIHVALRLTGKPWIGLILILGTQFLGATATSATERVVFSFILLFWRAPCERSYLRWFLVGLLLGSLQWIKFGGAIFLGFSLLLVDLCILCRTKSIPWRTWFRGISLCALAFCIVEAILITYYLATLPLSVAIDVIWPLYAGETYSYVDIPRVPEWYGFKFFILRQLLPFIEVVTGILGFLVWIRHLGRKDWTKYGVVFLPFLFYFIGFWTYISHYYNQISYYWCLALPICFATQFLSRRFILLLTLCLTPYWYHLAREFQSGRASANTELPNGVAVSFKDKKRLQLYQICQQALQETGKPPLILPMGSGFYWANGVSAPSRHTWYIPAYFRPYDRELFLANLRQIQTIVIEYSLYPDDPSLLQDLSVVFGEEIAKLLNSRVDKTILHEGRYKAYRLKPQD